MLVMKLGKRVQPRLDLAPVILGRPIIGELLHRRQLHALAGVGDRLAVGPAGRLDAPLEVGQIFVRGMKFERPDRRVLADRFRRCRRDDAWEALPQWFRGLWREQCLYRRE